MVSLTLITLTVNGRAQMLKNHFIDNNIDS